MASSTVTINVDLDIGYALRKTLVALGWTPPNELPSVDHVGPHPLVDKQQSGATCLLFVERGRVCARGPDDPIHQPTKIVRADTRAADLLARAG